MKNPLRYQISEYDCGPTSLLNALSFLFDREEISPELIRNIMLYSLDCYEPQGRLGKRGTSRMAMMFLSNWLTGVGEMGILPIESRYLAGEAVFIGRTSPVIEALHCGGVAVVRLNLDGEHYVLLTQEKDDCIYLFDPYYLPSRRVPPEVKSIADHPKEYNRLVPFALFNRETTAPYALGKTAEREAVLLFNKRTMLQPEDTIEYFI
ncbi:MAG: peptidase C39 [Selenomonadaceae bacterium]|nr:peptidase C39 [Selenomonadaceae bacterium]